MASTYKYQALGDSDAGKTSNGCLSYEQSGVPPTLDEETEIDPFAYRLNLAWYDYLKVRAR